MLGVAASVLFHHNIVSMELISALIVIAQFGCGGGRA